MLLVLRLILSVLLAVIAGNMIKKLKLPSILGWLIAGMIIGPHGFALMNESLLNAEWYQITIHFFEATVGVMIGSELVWKRLKKAGKMIFVTTLTQSLGTFLIVSFAFSAIFHFIDLPFYMGFIFGGIALATAPAPALSIVKEFETEGPVTNALIPMAALDDIVGSVVFFTTIALVSNKLSAGDSPAYMIPLVIFAPLLLGAVVGAMSGYLLKKENSSIITLAILLTTLAVSVILGLTVNSFLSDPIINFMLVGMAFSGVLANMVSEERLEEILIAFNPILNLALIMVILSLGAPLDYHLILGAGWFTAIYIVSRTLGKYFGAYFGASITHAPETVKKYLGFTLLPHSGVSLVFTGIAVSTLSASAPEEAVIIQGTSAAAAVINEIIAVFMAKKGFEWAGEFHKEENYQRIEAR